MTKCEKFIATESDSVALATLAVAMVSFVQPLIIKVTAGDYIFESPTIVFFITLHLPDMTTWNVEWDQRQKAK